MYRLREGSGSDGAPRAQLLGSGTILREVLAAAELLESDLGRQRRRVERHLVQRAAPRRPGGRPLEHAAPAGGAADARSCRNVCPADGGPVVASSDYIRGYADLIRAWVPGRYRVLGTDGFGRSDFRRSLRKFFEVDRHYVTVAALAELAAAGDDRSGPRPGGDRALRARSRGTGTDRRYDRDRSHPGRGAGHRRLRGRPGDRDPRRCG